MRHPRRPPGRDGDITRSGSVQRNPRVDERRAVPGEQPTRHQAGRQPPERLRPVARGEHVRLVRAAARGRPPRGRPARRGRPPGSAPAPPPSTPRSPARASRSAVNVGRPTTIHGSRQTGTTTRAVAGGTGPHQAASASTSQRGSAGHLEHLPEQPPHRGDRLRHGLDVGDPDRDAALPQPPDVELAVLLLVRDDEVRAQRRHGGEVGVLGAPHPGDPAGVEVGGVGAPVGRPDEPLGAGRRQRLGERRARARPRARRPRAARRRARGRR